MQLILHDNHYNALLTHTHTHTRTHTHTISKEICLNTVICVCVCFAGSLCGFLSTSWGFAVTALPGYRFIIVACLISTAGQAAAVIRQDLECGAHCAVVRAWSSAVQAGRITCLADWLIIFGVWALQQRKSLLTQQRLHDLQSSLAKLWTTNKLCKACNTKAVSHLWSSIETYETLWLTDATHELVAFITGLTGQSALTWRKRETSHYRKQCCVSAHDWSGVSKWKAHQREDQ